MAQLTRGQLKSIVKECLVEILSEGLSGGEKNLISAEPLQERRALTSKTPVTPPRSASPALNSVVFGQGNSSSKKTSNTNTSPRRPIPEAAIKNQINSITSDPIMSQIFADTATSTLQEQIHADRGQGRADVSSELVSDPLTDDFLSESAKHWSALAFSDSPKAR